MADEIQHISEAQSTPIQFEDILPWNDGAGDTGLSARLKLKRNFEKIKMWMDANGRSPWEVVVDPETGKKSAHLRDEYEGAWTDGYLSALGKSDGDDGGGSGDGSLITIDDKLSLSSTNPVQNKVITKDIAPATDATCIQIIDEIFQESGGGGGGEGGGGGSVVVTSLGDLSDVTISSPKKGDALIYDVTNNIWVNGQVENKKGTKVYLEKNDYNLTSDMLTISGVVYVISYDYTINSSVTIPTGCTLGFAGGSINGGTLVLNGTYLYGNVRFGTGVAVSGTCKNGTAYQKWFANNDVNAWHRFINSVEGVEYFEYTSGTYTPTVYVNKQIANKSSVNINGNNAVLKYSYTAGNTVYTIKPKDADVYSHVDIISPVSKGDTTVVVSSAAGMSVGDIISLRDNTDYSFSPFRADYRQCEFATIIEISGNTLRLAHPVYGQYINVGNIKVYTFNRISCHVSDISIMVTNPKSVADKFVGLEIFQSIGGGITNVRVDGYKTCIRFYYCADMAVDVCVAHVTVNQGNKDSYGLSIANCQNMNVIGGEYLGGNHGVSIGGGSSGIAVISREILVKNVRAKSIRSGFVNGIDMHGNAEFVTIEGCTTEGIYMRGRNNNVINNFIYGSDIACGELENYNHNIRGNILKEAKIAIAADSPQSGAAWIQDSVEDTLVIKDNKTFDCPSIPSKYNGEGVIKPALRHFITTSIDASYYNLDNTKIVISGNEVHNGLLNVTGFTTVIVRDNVFTYDSDTNSLARSKPKLTCTTCFIEGNKYIGYGHNSHYIGSSNYEESTVSWSYNNIDASYVYIRGNYCQTDMSIISKPLFGVDSSITELFIENNIANGMLLLSNNTVGRAVISNNTFQHYYVRPSDGKEYFQGVNINPGTNDYCITQCVVMNNIVASGSTGSTNAIILYAQKIAYGRNIRLDTMELTTPKIQKNTAGCIITNLDGN